MASAFSHAIASVAIGSLNFESKKDWKFWALGAFCAVVPDADAIGYWNKVPYASLWGHRGITHSIFFAVLLAGIVMIVCYRQEKSFSKPWWALYLTFFFATLSHPLLDACTTGGLGVAFFAPFYDERYFFPWKVIKVSPISITRFFSNKGLQVLESEFVWVWIPSLVIIFLANMIKRFRRIN